MSLLTRDNLIGAFITGTKRADLHPGIGNARPPARLAIPLAAVTLAGTTYGVTLNDPLAFTLSSYADAGDRSGGVERGEHGDD